MHISVYIYIKALRFAGIPPQVCVTGEHKDPHHECLQTVICATKECQCTTGKQMDCWLKKNLLNRIITHSLSTECCWTLWSTHANVLEPVSIFNRKKTESALQTASSCPFTCAVSSWSVEVTHIHYHSPSTMPDQKRHYFTARCTAVHLCHAFTKLEFRECKYLLNMKVQYNVFLLKIVSKIFEVVNGNTQNCMHNHHVTHWKRSLHLKTTLPITLINYNITLSLWVCKLIGLLQVCVWLISKETDAADFWHRQHNQLVQAKQLHLQCHALIPLIIHTEHKYKGGAFHLQTIFSNKLCATIFWGTYLWLPV